MWKVTSEFVWKTGIQSLFLTAVFGHKLNFEYWILFSLVLLTSLPSVNICGRRWAEESEQWTGYKRFIFLLPFSRASSKIPRLPRLAHKVPVLWCRLTIGMLKSWKHCAFCFLTIMPLIHLKGIKDVGSPSPPPPTSQRTWIQRSSYLNTCCVNSVFVD